MSLHVCLFFCSVCICICLFVYLSVRLSLWLCIYRSAVCLPDYRFASMLAALYACPSVCVIMSMCHYVCLSLYLFAFCLFVKLCPPQNMTVYVLPNVPPTHLLICLHKFLPKYIATYLTTNPFTYLYLLIYVSTYQRICLRTNLHTHLRTTYLSTHNHNRTRKHSPSTRTHDNLSDH